MNALSKLIFEYMGRVVEIQDRVKDLTPNEQIELKVYRQVITEMNEILCKEFNNVPNHHPEGDHP